MGALCPSPALSPALVAQVADEIVRPTLAELGRRRTPFCGFLFVGLMLTSEGPKLLELNVRLGDPEAQVILPQLQPGELLRLCVATARGELDGLALGVESLPTCAVVLAAPGYPAAPQLGQALALGDGLEQPDRWFIHAGTRATPSGLVTAGGRVGAVVARAATAAAARALAYSGVAAVDSPGLIYRHDIGAAT
jgi:phosphoribosylamine--glycine ligase